MLQLKNRFPYHCLHIDSIGKRRQEALLFITCKNIDLPQLTLFLKQKAIADKKWVETSRLVNKKKEKRDLHCTTEEKQNVLWHCAQCATCFTALINFKHHRNFIFDNPFRICWCCSCWKEISGKHWCQTYRTNYHFSSCTHHRRFVSIVRWWTGANNRMQSAAPDNTLEQCFWLILR